MVKAGRPTKYSAEMVSTICERIALGESLRSICRDDAMPHVSSVIKWLSENPDFSAQYARARESGIDSQADEMHDLEMKVLNGELDPNAFRAAMDARKWRMARQHPRKYGDRLNLDHSGEMTFNNKSDDELKSRLSQLLPTKGSGSDS